MKVNAVAVPLFGILAIFLGIQSSAEERNAEEHKMKRELSIEERERIYAATQVTINGKETPDLVPDYVRMYFFFSRYGRPNHPYRRDLQKRLSARDDAILFAYAQKDDALKARDMEDHHAGFMSICAAGESMTPLELATALDLNTQRYQERRNARYRAVIKQLSSQGQQIVTEFAYQRIRPVTSSRSAVMHATLAPEHFKEQTLYTYEAHRSGRMKELDEEFTRQQQLEHEQRSLQRSEQPVTEKPLSTRVGSPTKEPK